MNMNMKPSGFYTKYVYLNKCKKRVHTLPGWYRLMALMLALLQLLYMPTGAWAATITKTTSDKPAVENIKINKTVPKSNLVQSNLKFSDKPSDAGITKVHLF